MWLNNTKNDLTLHELPDTYPSIQGVPLPFHLFQTSVSSRIFDLEQKFLHQYAAYGCTFYMTKICKIGRLVEF